MPTQGPVFASKSDFAYEEVRSRILSGAISPGAIIGQAKLATEIGLSTTPLREALKRLATEGLVTLDNHRDARVVELSSDEAQHLFEVRATVDPLACALAAERRTVHDLTRIDAALRDLEPLTGAPTTQALIAHRAFHRAIYLSAGNPLLVNILDSIWDKGDLYRLRALRSRTPSAEDRVRVHEQHQALREAISEGNVKAAESLSRAHVTHSLGRRAIGLLDEPSE
ncbi:MULTISPECIES: GntR family transcriptional regulator [unclassified Microbacterium]|uniref:GntR family transcriptional regulator n=1 Tax=unclassified Microbacterium TaxID=2609290 RepID=UPI003467B8CF